MYGLLRLSTNSWYGMGTRLLLEGTIGRYSDELWLGLVQDHQLTLMSPTSLLSIVTSHCRLHCLSSLISDTSMASRVLLQEKSIVIP